MNNLTIVTALFDLGRDKLPEGFRRDFSHYIECFEKFLVATKAYPLIIFLEKENEEVVWRHRDRKNTQIVFKTLDYLRGFPFYNQVQDIRNRPEWVGQSGWMPDSPQAKLELYNPLVMSKQFMLNDATLFGYFDTKYFLWMDAGLNNTVNLQQYIDEDFGRRITPHMNKMLYLCFPYDGDVEVHGFTKKPMDGFAGEQTKYVARGGVFGGSKDAINRMNEKYYSTLNDTINAGYMGTEESIFTILTYKHKDMCNVRMIDGNGLVYKFFEDIRNQPIRSSDIEELAIYALTFNLPQQFELFVESFKKAHPRDFKRVKKYVINNSNDPSVDAEYQRIFKENDFQEFKFDNIGINGGRHFAAEHFDKSDHEYMIFFEDDMLMHIDPNARCKMGFTTHHTQLIDKSIEIVKNENLDYLKLCFSEFYGDNHDNWAWHNVRPESLRNEYFPPRDDDVSPLKVKVDYTGTLRGLPYSVGEYHYCNWPLVFTKRGSRKLFLEEVYAHKYEQTWMSLAMRLIRNKELKVATLLASPINHFRKYHYGENTRRENEHYRN
jgi:hypothetical protein